MKAAAGPEILLVEDDPDDALLTLRALRAVAADAAVEHAADGFAALSRLTAFERAGPARPRLVLLDLKLPGLSGFEVLESVRAESPERGTPVVVLSASREAEDVRRAYAAGANGYLVKSHSAEERRAQMAAVVEFWMRRNVVADVPGSVGPPA
jgi:CheY-like chemotaxis protein